MPGLSFWSNQLKEHITEKHIAFSSLGEITSLCFLSEETLTQEHAIYMADETSLSPDKLCSLSGAPCTIFTASATSSPLIPRTNDNLIRTNLSQMELYQCLSDSLALWQNLRLRVISSVLSVHMYSSLSESISSLTDCFLFFPDRSFELPVHTKEEEAPDALEAASRFLRTKKEQLLSEPARRYSCFTSDQYLFHLLRLPAAAGVHLLLLQPRELSRTDGQSLLLLVQRALRLSASRNQQGTPPESPLPFAEFLPQILSGDVSSPHRAETLFSRLEIPVERFFCFFLIRTENPTENLFGKLLPHLENFFPGCPMTLYQDQIVILFSCPERFTADFPTLSNWLNPEIFRDFLAENRCFCLIGTPTSRRTHIQTAYLLADRTFSIIRKLWHTGESRLFLLDDYVQYLVIDLCCRSYTELVGHSDLIYLTQPEVIRLYRYDREHHDQLLDVLYHYCLNDCNLSRTARSAFMHRNTVSAKIEKIRSIISADLTDGNTRQRMIFSYRILRYAETCQKMDLDAWISRRFES